MSRFLAGWASNKGLQGVSAGLLVLALAGAVGAQGLPRAPAAVQTPVWLGPAQYSPTPGAPGNIAGAPETTNGVPAVPGGAFPFGGGSGGTPSPEATAVPGAGLPSGSEPAPPGSGDNFPLSVSYKYNAGGGYTALTSKDGDFTINLQNQITLDGTFYDRANVGTSERNFNIPFYRTYLFGNITKDWDYQASVQGFLGSFNVLDLWLNHKFSDALNIRFGRQLSPLLYEYYGFSPAWEPVITNSPLFQVAGKRQLGVMAWGKLLNNKIQYQQGVFNGVSGGFFDLDNSVDYIGSLDVTPFKGSGTIWDSLGGGLGVQTGRHNYSLAAGAVNNFVNGAGEPTTNAAFVGSTGIPFLLYQPTMAVNGMQTRVAPHIYWYGRFSVLAEFIHQDRALLNTANGVRANESLNGYYVNVSYFLTGEKYSGDGLGGYTTITPLRPFIPSKGCYGPGAWELAAQYSQMALGNNVLAAGFVDPTINATRLTQTMFGVNWWMNKYTRVSLDWINDHTNRGVPIGVGGSGRPTSTYNIYWARLAMFF